jgi:type 1 glutamine amidotransferase
MPEGLDTIGVDGVRDLLTYICSDDEKYRFIDLRSVATADSTQGIYAARERRNESLLFSKFGIVKVDDVPFEILHPSKTLNGNNVIVLRSRNGVARDYPRRVEVADLNLKARRLHFLGGIGGWAWPYGGDEAKGLPAGTITVTHADGTTELWGITNGVHIADYNTTRDVPGSKAVSDLVTRGQVRAFSRDVRGQSPIAKIALESMGNEIATTFVAITAELAEGAQTKVTTGQPAVYADASAVSKVVGDAATGGGFKWGQGIRTLIVGGGASHDYPRWFGQADTATLSADGKASVNYTEDTDSIGPALKDVDVLYLSNNKPFNDPATRKAIVDHVEAGKGLLLVHPGLWYNWKDWPEYNRVLCGGGARGHDKYGEFEVTLTGGVKHPVTAGVPASFKISDECYWFEPDGSGTPIEVLATAYSAQKGKSFPSVFVVKHPKARIVGIALGHDGKAHEHPAYKSILQNSLKWVAGK